MGNTNQLIESNVRAIGESSLKALISAVPILGGPLSSLLGDYFSGRKERRFIEFLEGISKDLENGRDSVNEEFVSKEDFYDIFELTARKIVLTRQEEKREAYRKILTNSMTSKDISYDEMEEFIFLLDGMRPEHIFLLKVLKDPVKYDEENGNLVGKGGGFSTSISQIMNKLLPNWDETSIIDVAAKLEDDRLIKDIIRNYKTMMTDQGINHLGNRLTDKGKRLSTFILE